MCELNRRLLERRDWKPLIKNYASLFHERLHGKYPLILQVLNGRLFMALAIIGIEVIYWLNRRLWALQWSIAHFRVK